MRIAYHCVFLWLCVCVYARENVCAYVWQRVCVFCRVQQICLMFIFHAHSFRFPFLRNGLAEEKASRRKSIMYIAHIKYCRDPLIRFFSHPNTFARKNFSFVMNPRKILFVLLVFSMTFQINNV